MSYPKWPRYVSGDIDKAESFTCVDRLLSSPGQAQGDEQSRMLALASFTVGCVAMVRVSARRRLAPASEPAGDAPDAFAAIAPGQSRDQDRGAPRLRRQTQGDGIE